MSNICKIQLNTSCILDVPILTYDNDFTFIVNGKKFKTNRIISDLISSKICHLHKNDPTINTFTINTEKNGDFSHFLEITNFCENSIPEGEVPFILEVIEKLKTNLLSFQQANDTTETTIDNVLHKIINHSKFPYFYSKSLESEISFAACHFFELVETKEEEMKNLDADTLYAIASSSNLQLNNEDQLLKFINGLYLKNSKLYSILYETVIFKNASSETMKEFVGILDFNDLMGGAWTSLSERLEIEIKNEIISTERYKGRINKNKMFSHKDNGDFKGIINYLQIKSTNNIENEITVTSSTIYSNNIKYRPLNVVMHNKKELFWSNDKKNSWLCIDFKENRILPTEYTIRSSTENDQNWYHPKNWVVEVCDDNSSWEVIDTQNNCSFLNGRSLVHTFQIQNKLVKEVRYFRLRQTGKNWGNYNDFAFDSIEIYGTLISKVD